MAREPKGFSKKADGTYSAKDVEFATKIKQQFDEIAKLKRQNAQFDQKQLDYLKENIKSARSILEVEKEMTKNARERFGTIEDLAKGAASETKILGDGLAIRKLIVDTETAQAKRAAGRTKSVSNETRGKLAQLDIAEQLLQTGRDEILTSSQILDLEEKLVEAQRVNSKFAKQYVGTLKDAVRFEKAKADLGQDAVDAMKEGEDTIDQMNKGVQEMIAKFKVLGSGAVGFTAKLGVALVIAKQLVDTVSKLLTPFVETRDALGVSFGSADKIVGSMKSIGKSLKESGVDLKLFGKGIEDVQQIGVALVDDLGFIPENLAASAVNITAIAGRFGIANDEAAKLVNEFALVGGTSLETAQNVVTAVGTLAELNNVAPAMVMKDLADATAEFAEFSKDGGANLAGAAIQARRLGVSLSTTAKISNSLLDFQSSIEKELEASLLIGRQLNFNKARELAFTGDIEGATQSVVKQLGGRAEFEKLNVFAKRALAESIGVDVGELSRLVGGRQVADASGKMPGQTEETENFTRQTKSLVDAIATQTLDLSEVLKGDDLAGGSLLKLGAFLRSDLGNMIGTAATTAALLVVGKGASKAFSKIAGKKVVEGGAKMATKEVSKEVAEQALKNTVKKEATEEITEQVVKRSLGKRVLSKIPLIGAVLGVGFAIDRAMGGDFKGAGLELLSGAASTIPGKGTAASLAIDAINVARDVSIAKEQAAIQSNSQPPVNNIDDLIQLQTTESDNTRVNDAEMLFQLQELNKNMKKVDSSIQGLVD